MELGSFQLHAPRMRGFKQTKSQPAEPALCRRGARSQRPKMDVPEGAGGVRRVYLFLLVSLKLTTTWNSRAKDGRAHGRSGLCVGRSPCPLAAASAEAVSAEIVVSPSLPREKWSRRLAVYAVLLLFLGVREVAIFPKCTQSQAAGLLGSFSRADPLFFLWEKHGFSVSWRFLFLFGTRGKLFKILFQFWLNLFF